MVNVFVTVHRSVYCPCGFDLPLRLFTFTLLLPFTRCYRCVTPPSRLRYLILHVVMPALYTDAARFGFWLPLRLRYAIATRLPRYFTRYCHYLHARVAFVRLPHRTLRCATRLLRLPVVCYY